MTTAAHPSIDTMAPPPDAPLDSKGSRTAMTKCLNAVDDLSPDERERVIRALAALFGVGT